MVAEKDIRSYRSERVQRVTIYNERDNKPHLSAAQLAETTEKGDHVEKCTQVLTDLNPTNARDIHRMLGNKGPTYTITFQVVSS